MYSIVSTAIIHGIQSVPISVEADVSDGLPVFEMVGFLASEVQEAKERVRTALKNCGFALPPKHITINFTPANIRKSGSGFDLPVAVAVLTAFGYIRQGIFCSGRGWTEWKSTTGKWNFANGGGGKRKRNEKMYGSMEKCRRGGIGIGHAGICRKKSCGCCEYLKRKWRIF